MGFERDATHAVWPVAQHRSDPIHYELARCSRLGNTFHAGGIAWLFGQLFFQRGILEAPASVAEIADPGFAAACAARHGVACALEGTCRRKSLGELWCGFTLGVSATKVGTLAPNFSTS